MIRNFCNKEGVLFLLDKKSGRISKQHSSKKIFQIENLNTLIDESGNANHYSLEKYFKTFEDDFQKHYAAISSLVVNIKPQSNLSLEDNSIGSESLLYFKKLALIGYCRNPHISAYADKAFESTLVQILQMEGFSFENDENSMLHLDYDKLLSSMLKLLGSSFVRMLAATSGHHFVLPDTTGYYERAGNRVKHVVNGNTMFEIKNHIKRIILPLSSQIIMEFDSVECPSMNGSCIVSFSENDTLLYNRMLVDSAHNHVICADRCYLQKHFYFTEGMSNHNSETKG